MSTIKKLLSLDELSNFCLEHEIGSFDAKETGYTLSVQVPGIMEFAKKQSNTLLYTLVKVCHTELNRNHSYIAKEDMERAMPTLKNQPLLAAFISDDDGNIDFDAHNMSVVENEDGSKEVQYEERQIGSFDSTVEPYFEYDEEQDKTYVMAVAAIPREYSPAADIIERKNGTKVSCELMINKMSVNAKEKRIELIDFEFTGVTCLGEHVGEGMLGSRADIIDFSTENNSVKYDRDDNIIKLLEELTAKVDALSINNNSKEGGTEVEQEEVFEEVTTTEEVVVETAEETTEEEVVTEGFSEETTEVSPEVEPIIEFTVKTSEDVKTYSISLVDKLNAMYKLVNETYSELDNEYYDVNVYEDERYVEMYGWCTGRNFRQSYKVKGDSFTLVGDRVEIFARYLSEDEIKSLETMKAKYSELEQFKLNREAEIAHEERMNLLITNDYSAIAQTDEYKSLIDNIDAYELNEIVEKADSIVGKYARQGMQFTVQNATDKTKKAISLPTKETTNPKSYSGLFDD